MNNPGKNNKEDLIRKRVLQTLSEFLGIGAEEIMDEDSFSDDLHMTTSDFTEFIAKLEAIGVDTGELDIDDTGTVADLVEEIHLKEPL